MFIESTITHFFLILHSEISLKTGQYLMKLIRTKKLFQFFGPPCRKVLKRFVEQLERNEAYL